MTFSTFSPYPGLRVGAGTIVSVQNHPMVSTESFWNKLDTPTCTCNEFDGIFGKYKVSAFKRRVERPSTTSRSKDIFDYRKSDFRSSQKIWA